MWALLEWRVSPATTPRADVLPVRGIKAGEGGHKVDAAIVGHGSGERFNVRTSLNESEVVAQPLHQRAGDGDAAFQRVACGLGAKFIGDGSEHPEFRRHRPFAGIHQQKASRAVGVFRFARFKAGLSDERGLLIAKDAGDRHIFDRSEPRFSENFAAGGDARQDLSGMPQSSRISRSHARVSRFISWVRLAFVTSVTWIPPQDRR